MTTLHIDTSGIKKAVVTLEIDGVKHKRSSETGKGNAQAVLPLAEELLREHHLKPEDIGAITVNPGPGSFTGLRIGAAIAKTFSLLLGIRVNAKSAWDDIPLVYENSKFD